MTAPDKHSTAWGADWFTRLVLSHPDVDTIIQKLRRVVLKVGTVADLMWWVLIFTCVVLIIYCVVCGTILVFVVRADRCLHYILDEISVMNASAAG